MSASENTKKPSAGYIKIDISRMDAKILASASHIADVHRRKMDEMTSLMRKGKIEEVKNLLLKLSEDKVVVGVARTLPHSPDKMKDLCRVSPDACVSPEAGEAHLHAILVIIALAIVGLGMFAGLFKTFEIPGRQGSTDFDKFVKEK
jgi:hypothetical protein